MKKITTAVILFAVIMTGCNNNSSEKRSADDTKVTEKTAPETATKKDDKAPTTATEEGIALTEQDISKGKALIEKSDCLACHKEDVKLIGPAYVAVAKKYKPTTSDLNYLSNKIIKGGSGVWGEIPMAPHPSISVEDSKKMAKYILSLKN